MENNKKHQLQNTKNVKFINVDGNTACSLIAYYLSEVAEIYPITPSSTMAENCDEWSEKGKKNIFGNTLLIKEMQSEAGVAGALHGSLTTGALSTTFTASQGLLLMIPDMFKIAGELLPCVIHVSARAIATHALSIFGDHSDVMSTRTTGFNMLCSCNVQEAHDLSLIAHLSTLECSLPFLHFFDGFRTSHEVQKISLIDENTIKSIYPYKKVEEFKNKMMNSQTPFQKGTAQNPDIFFQNREASNKYYNKVYSIVEKNMEKIEKITGRKYKPFQYFGSPTAKYVIIMMGSGAETAEETIDYLNSQNSFNISLNDNQNINNNNSNEFGLVKVRLYRPFNPEGLINELPNTVEKIAVLDRTKENGAVGEPLYLDVVTGIESIKNKLIIENQKNKTLNKNNLHNEKEDFNKNSQLQKLLNIKQIVGGRYGLGGKEFTPSCVKAVLDNLISTNTINNFTVGIEDDITFNSLKLDETFKIENKEVISMKFYGLGSDGTVSANKNSIKIIGELTPYYTQGYFEYDSKKSGSLTISHLRLSKKLIKSTYAVSNADFIAIHNYSFVARYNILKDLNNEGVVLLNTTLNEKQLNNDLPKTFVDYIKNKNARLFIINANKIAKECGLNGKINVVMQSAFFKIINIIPEELIQKNLKEVAEKTYGHKGQNVIEANHKAIERGMSELKEIDTKHLIGKNYKESKQTESEYYKNFIEPINKQQGNYLPVSSFPADGKVPTNTSKFEKRGIAQQCPKWIKENCIQCGLCVMSCPHSALRGHLFDKNKLQKDINKEKISKQTNKNLKEVTTDINEFIEQSNCAYGTKDLNYKLQLSPLDCTGCGVCKNVCPAKNKALEMVISEEILEQEKNNFEVSKNLPNINNPFNLSSPKGLQFEEPFFEYNYACAGCGETPYIKLATTLFGKNMIIANATGCSSIYAGSAPTCPFTKNQEGCGPAWANSLFEDNAEFGYGMKLGINSCKSLIRKSIGEILQLNQNYLEEDLQSSLQEWLVKEDFDSLTKQNELIKDLENLKQKLKNSKDKKIIENIDNIINNKLLLRKTSVWIIGGDGWAYDIGYGGLDHVLASNEDINILVLDTEVYSNTGGQSSKSTPKGAFAKFAMGGKQTAKKDLGSIAMNYDNVYVASVAIGADINQAIKAFKEAEEHKGPSIIIAYAPCINHGFDMSKTFEEMKKAVQSGYWTLYRYNPNEKIKLIIDSQEPTWNYEEFLKGETRFKALEKKNPKEAKQLFEQSKQEAKTRYSRLKLKQQEENLN